MSRATTTIVAVGWTAAIHVSHTASASSPKLSIQLLNGSGLVLAAARALALGPCDVSATPPARGAAPPRPFGRAATLGPYASNGARGGGHQRGSTLHPHSPKRTF